jgi:hypothetical protein
MDSKDDSELVQEKHTLAGPWNLYYSRRGKQSKHSEYKENL